MISFQVIDICDGDEVEDEEELRYIVRIFGRCPTDDSSYPDASVCITVEGFEPFFYIRGPWNTHKIQTTLDWLDTSRGIKPTRWSHNTTLRDFDGFHAEETASFLCLYFKSAKDLRRTASAIQSVLSFEIDIWVDENWDDLETLAKVLGITINEIEIGDPYPDTGSRHIRLHMKDSRAYNRAIDTLTRDKYSVGIRQRNPRHLATEDMMRGDALRLYESNLDPVLRFMHVTGIKGCSFISVNTTPQKDNASLCDLEACVPWTMVKPVTDSTTTARFRICAYDIEVYSCDGSFPQAERETDQIIQVGMTFNHWGTSDCYRRILLSLKECQDIPGCQVFSFTNEKDLLRKFIDVIHTEDPDILVGYNTFGFDNLYMHTRSNEDEDFALWGRLRHHVCKFKKKKLSSSALGDNLLYFYDSPGRIQVDLLKVIQRDYNLPSYSLDTVSSHFNQNAIQKIVEPGLLQTRGWTGLSVGNYFKVKTVELGVVDNLVECKYKVLDLPDANHIRYDGSIPIPHPTPDMEVKWTMAKDDLPPRDIFRLWTLGPSERAIVGAYCIRDCDLVNFLMERLDVLMTNIAMANITIVPLRFIFLRGQGIKSFSLVVEQCRRDGYVVPTIRKDDYSNIIFRGQEKDRLGPFGKEDTECTFCDAKGRFSEYTGGTIVCDLCRRIQYHPTYQGAIVLDPLPGRYTQPIVVLDFSSLYPRSIISRNISWETLVKDPRYDNLPGYHYFDVTYRDYDKTEVRCRFAQNEDGSYGIIPKILTELLRQRSLTKKKMKDEKDPFKKKILDGIQLSQKITANSLYGTLGAVVSSLFNKPLAACTTAVGQYMLLRAKAFVEEELAKVVGDETLRCKVIYGDTDSIFCDFGITGGSPRDQRERAIQLGQLVEEKIKPFLDKPHELAYEKIFAPFIILTKKRYCAYKYENSPDHHCVSLMGISLKRRDSALVSKVVCGGILKRMLDGCTSEDIVEFTKNTIQNMDRYSIDYFVTSKRLKKEYKNPDSLAHVALARRMQERDPGSAPKASDRIQFAFIYNEDLLDKRCLQTEKIEEVNYIKEKGLMIDYNHYIERQIMVPACQFLSLIMAEPERLFTQVMKKNMRERRSAKGKKVLKKFGDMFTMKQEEEEKGFSISL